MQFQKNSSGATNFLLQCYLSGFISEFISTGLHLQISKAAKKWQENPRDAGKEKKRYVQCKIYYIYLCILFIMV